MKWFAKDTAPEDHQGDHGVQLFLFWLACRQSHGTRLAYAGPLRGVLPVFTLPAQQPGPGASGIERARTRDGPAKLESVMQEKEVR